MPPHSHVRPNHAESWIVNVEREQTGAHSAETLRSWSAGIERDGAIELGDQVIVVPPSIYTVLRHEPGHDADVLFRLDLKWFEDGTLPLPHRPPPAHHIERWLFNFEGTVTAPQTAGLLQMLAGGLAGDEPLRIGEHAITIPPMTWSVQRHCRGPRGDLILKFELRWPDEPGIVAMRPIAEILGA
jgi:hypothetical protein